MRTALIGIAISVVCTASALAEIANVEKATIVVDGVHYTFPVGGPNRKAEIYYLKKGMLGDEVAMEMFLEGKEEKWFYIGEDFPLWLKVTKHDLSVIKP